MSDWMFGVPGLASAPLATLRLEHNYIIAHSARFFPRLPQVKRAGGAHPGVSKGLGGTRWS